MLTESQLKEALAFYEIPDPAYYAATRDCLHTVAVDPTLSRSFDTAFARIYTHDPVLRSTIWEVRSSLDALFGGPMPTFIANLFILSGYAFHRENMERIRLDEAQKKIQLFRVRQQLLMPGKVAPIGIVPILWSSKFICMEIVEVGRLQYDFKPLVGENPVRRVALHIPPEGKLDPESVMTSLRAAVPYVERTFGQPADEYVCTTWLLSNQLAPLFAPGSNLASFHDLFTVTDAGDAFPDLCNYLFHVSPSTPISGFPEETSLQRKVKALLLTGKEVRLGSGVLKPF